MKRRRIPRQPRYKSKLEKIIGDKLGSRCSYEEDNIRFVQPAKNRIYKPDFKIDNKRFIEVKGRFTPQDRMKHLWVKEQHPKIKIFFIFGRPQNKINKHSSTTYADWADTNGFEWIGANDEIPQSWFKGR